MRIVDQCGVCTSWTPDALQMIEQAGRTCYKSEAHITINSATAFVRMLIKRGHEAMIEHAYATFRFVCDRGLTHEPVRHRLASFAQESTRFCRYSGGIVVVKPIDRNRLISTIGIWRSRGTVLQIGSDKKDIFELMVFPCDGLNCNAGCERNGVFACNTGVSDCPYHLWEDACRNAEVSYLAMLDRGIKPQIARAVLPTCLKTELVMTVNFREWRHVMRLRMSEAAHPQIQVLIRQVYDWFKGIFPVIVEDIVPSGGLP